MKNTWGKFTPYGSKELEQKIQMAMEDVALALSKILSPFDYHALILIGGYGRGEGGVECKEGKEHPHNNFDFLLITKAISAERTNDLDITIRAQLGIISKAHKINIDFSMIRDRKLKFSSNLVIWHDMYHGHKTILGDRNLVPSLKRFSKQNFPAWDVRNLLVNRGTLLVINDVLGKINKAGHTTNKMIIKHINKAIIGYGDALLFFKGSYSWSYLEKQRRMKKMGDIPETFKRIYDQAIQFRFMPDYEAFRTLDLTQWQNQIRVVLENIHVQCETIRLGKKEINWDEYPKQVFQHVFHEGVSSLRQFLRLTKNFIKSHPCPMQASLVTKLGFRFSSEKDIFSAFYPVVAYNLQSNYLRNVMKSVFKAKSDQLPDLKSAYLSYWNNNGDTNFFNLLNQYNMVLE